MHYIPIIASLTAAASALNIWFRPIIQCTGAYFACTNVPERTCRYTNEKSAANSTEYANLPSNSFGFSFSKDQTTNKGDAHSCSGGDGMDMYLGESGDLCLPFAPGNYRFSCAKWAVNRNGTSTSCPAIQKAETLVLYDGNKYTLKGMDEGSEQQLYILAWNGTTKDELPACL